MAAVGTPTVEATAGALYAAVLALRESADRAYAELEDGSYYGVRDELDYIQDRSFKIRQTVLGFIEAIETNL